LAVKIKTIYKGATMKVMGCIYWKIFTPGGNISRRNLGEKCEKREDKKEENVKKK
jgi:hypothetical protein